MRIPSSPRPLNERSPANSIYRRTCNSGKAGSPPMGPSWLDSLSMRPGITRHQPRGSWTPSSRTQFGADMRFASWVIRRTASLSAIAGALPGETRASGTRRRSISMTPSSRSLTASLCKPDAVQAAVRLRNIGGRGAHFGSQEPLRNPSHICSPPHLPRPFSNLQLPAPGGRSPMQYTYL
jgi:hypothetical protein